ncbi:MAG: hypothetical protein JNK72_25820, partial [Myxococcales bacterium]|nr:hypothetical protein [Myxococcales bacterium]
GCADEIVLQTIVLSTSSAVSVMAQFQTTNDGGRHWTDVTGLNPTASPTSTSDLPKSALVKATGALASPFAKQGRVKVVASGAATVTGIKVKVIACGRSR